MGEFAQGERSCQAEILEGISKPSQDNNQARQLGEAWEQFGMIFVSGDQPPKALQPTDRALDLPATPIAPQGATVLGGRLDAVAVVRANEFDAALLESAAWRFRW
jgi:hypothetical protein